MHVRTVAPDGLERVEPVDGVRHRPAFALEIAREQLDDRRLVVDHQDPDGAQLHVRSVPPDHIAANARGTSRGTSRQPCAATAVRPSAGVRPSRTRRRSCALAATMIVDALIAIAPTAIGRSSPKGTRTPAATGMATRL